MAITLSPETTGGDGVVPPPDDSPPPQAPHPAARATRISRNRSNLLDRIDAHPGRDQVRGIGPALHVADVPPFLDDNPVRLYLELPAARFALGLPQGVLIFARIGAKKPCEIGMHQSIPGNREDDSGWRYIFPDDRRIGFNLMNRVVAVGCHGAAYCCETLPVRLDGINR